MGADGAGRGKQRDTNTHKGDASLEAERERGCGEGAHRLARGTTTTPTICVVFHIGTIHLSPCRPTLRHMTALTVDPSFGEMAMEARGHVATFVGRGSPV